MSTGPEEQRDVREDVSRSAGFRPYVLWRRGTLAFNELRIMFPAMTWAHLDELEANTRLRREAAELLAQSLYGMIPKLDKESRGIIIRIRRDLHNDRRLDERMISLAETLLNPADAAGLRNWHEMRERAARDLVRVEETYKRELDTARRKLGEIAGDEEFLKGIQLSGRELLRSVLEYVDSARSSETHPRSKDVRKTESTIVRYAYRMALRTTPFASFTEIGAQPWSAAPAGAVAKSTERERAVRLNRGLLVWMASVLKNIDGADRLFSLRSNNTLVRGKAVEAFTRGMDGDGRSYWNERFVSLPESKPVALVLDSLSSGSAPRASVFALLSGIGLPAERVNAFLDKLVDIGLLHQDLDLPDQIQNYAQAVADKLTRVGSPQAAQCAESFSSLAQMETAFVTASAARRSQLMDDLYEQVERFAKICQVSIPPAVSESPVWEDVGSRSAARCWDPALLERNIERFSRLQQIIPLFDDMVPQRLGIYRWFAERFGEDGRCDDLLQLYREFASQSPGQISAVMQAEAEPRAKQIVDLRARFLRRLYEALEDSDGGSTLSVTDRLFDEFIDEFASWVPRWSSAAYWLQLVPSRQGLPASIVVNNVATGHGVFFSRFCDLVEHREKGEWSLAASLRDSIRSENPRQADLTAVFGINVNLHPNLSPLEVVYPGAIATTGAKALTVRDLGIQADSTTRTLRLYTRADGLPLDIVPLNFLFPAAAPMLYRFLCALGTSHNVRTRLWDRLRMTIAGHRSHFPQLRFGELVLERQSWFVSSQELAFLGDGTQLPSLKLLQEAERWRRDRNLPQEVFIRGADRAGMAQPDGNWADITRQWALEARSARRKPQYIDFRNPFLLRILANVAHSSSDGGIFFTECIPPTSIYADATGATSAEEFLVEFSMARRWEQHQ